jgi:hypothetical protein
VSTIIVSVGFALAAFAAAMSGVLWLAIVIALLGGIVAIRLANRERERKADVRIHGEPPTPQWPQGPTA